MRPTWLPLAVILVVLPLLLRAQSPGSRDPNFVTLPGTDAIPSALAAIPGGGVYVGGGFTNYAGTGRAGLVRLRGDGSLDATLTVPGPRLIVPPVVFNGQVLVAGSDSPGSISAVLALPDGRPVIAGRFTHLGAQAVPGLAILNSDGTPAVTSPAIDAVEPGALLPGTGGTFYVSGKGTVDGGRIAIVRLRADGSRDPAFVPPSLADLGFAGANAHQLMRGPDDTLYALLAAALPSATASYELIRLTATGQLDPGFADGGRAVIPNPTFGGMASSPSGQVAFSGLATYRGQALNRKINRLTLSGSIDPGFNASIDPGFGARVVAVQSDGKVIHTATSRPLNRLNTDGSVDAGYANPAQVPTPLLALSLTWFAPAPDGSLFAAGFTFGANFAVLNGAFHILGDPASGPSVVVGPVSQEITDGARARFEVTAEGAPPLTYQWRRRGLDLPGETGRQLVLDPVTDADAGEYSVVVSNALGTAPPVTATLTVLPAVPGTVRRETDPGAGTDAPILALEFDSEGGLLAGGGFTRFHGTNRVRVARLIDGARLVDPAFDTSQMTGVSLVAEILPLSSGRTLVAGNLQVSYGGNVHTGALRLGGGGAIDTAFNPSGASGETGNRFAERADGLLYVASRTWNSQVLPGGYARLTADGVRDPQFEPAAPFFGGNAVVALPDGGALVAGWTNLTVRGSGVLRLDASGRQVPGFHRGPLPGITASGVTDIVVQPDGRILVAGGFVRTDVLPQRNLGVIRLMPDGTLDPSFNPVPSLSALDGVTVDRIALQADGRILILGGFTRVGGFSRPGVARLWPNGVVDPGFQPPTPTHPGHPGTYAAVAVSTGNLLVVGGDFHALGGLPRTNVAVLNGGPLQPNPAAPGIASVTGRLTPPVGANVTLSIEPSGPGPFQFQWRRNLQAGSPVFQDIPGATNATLELAAIRLEESGLFQVSVASPGGSATSGFIPVLVRPDPVQPGRRDPSFVGAPSAVTAPVPGGTLFAALPNGVARVYEDGTPDTNYLTPPDLLLPDNSTDNRITAILRQPDGKLLVVGRLSTRTGPCNVVGATCLEPQRGIARLLPDGSYDPGFDLDNTFIGEAQNKPLAVALQSDGRILVAGSFDNFRGAAVAGLVRLEADGLPDPGFDTDPGLRMVLSNPPRILAGSAVALAVLPDDRIYVGGAFTHVHGAVRHGVVRLQADGSLDPGFVSPTDSSAATGTAGQMTFHALGPVTPEGGVFVFGTFRPVPNGPVRSALKLRADGTIDPSFSVTTDFQINTGALQADGRLLISGQFTRVNGQSRTVLARLNPDGSLDASFEYPSAGAGVGLPLTVLPDGTLLAGSLRYFLEGGAAPDRPALGFTLVPEGLRLSWPAGYHLQRSVGLVPALWQDVAGGSPLTVPPAGSGAFYRLVADP